MIAEPIKRDVVANYIISTVKLPWGLLNEDPYYETMVFRSIGEQLGEDVDVNVYSTLEAALKGHLTMVNKWAEETCFSCLDSIPVGTPVYQDSDEDGNKLELFLCDACAFDRFGKDDSV